MDVSIKNFTRRPRLGEQRVFKEIARTVLPCWDISLVFVGPTRAKALNKRLRGKSYTPNVLSYALGSKSGEVIICPSQAEEEAASFSMDLRSFIIYLFIHGILHLEGRAHGATMERCEQKLLAQFLPIQAGSKSDVRSYSHESTYRNRNRYRHVPSKGRRR